MPLIPELAPGALRAAPARPATRPALALGPLGATVPAATAPRTPPDRTASRQRLPTAPHLVTPRQGNEFYDASFRELELIERDLLQRGPFPAAEERVASIAREALELQAALGPAARSGDRDFGAALQRIEKVQAYLERIRPLFTERAGVVHLRPAVEPPSPRGGFFSRILGKGRPD